MKNSFMEAYFARDFSELNKYAISLGLRDAINDHFEGNLETALKKYKDLGLSFNKDLLCFIQLEIIFLNLKLGNKLDFEGLKKIKSFDLSLLLYKSFIEFNLRFWGRQGGIPLALAKVLLFALLVKKKSYAYLAIFLFAHDRVIKNKKTLTLSLARFSNSKLKSLFKGGESFFHEHLSFAVFPYSLLLKNESWDRINNEVLWAEKLLMHDPYCYNLFIVSKVYSCCYRGEILQSEEVLKKFEDLLIANKLKRYEKVAKIIRYLPFALRGYPHVVRKDFDLAIATYSDLKAEDIIESQFYRVASIFELISLNFEIAKKYLDLAVQYRDQSNSFHAWARLDNELMSHITRKLPLSYSVQAAEVFHLNRSLRDTAVSTILSYFFEVFLLFNQLSLRDLTDKIIQVVESQLQVKLIKKTTNDNEALPALRISGVYYLVHSTNESRDYYVFELCNVIQIPIDILCEAYIRFQDSLKQAERASKNYAVAQLAHDLRSPLATLKILTSHSKTIHQNDKEILVGCIERLADISSSILSPSCNLSRNQNLSLRELIQGFVSEKQLEYSGLRKLFIMYSVPDRDVFVPQYVKEKIIPILSNLVNNSVEESNSIRSVEIKVDYDPSSYVLSIFVLDDGIGFSDKILALGGKTELTSNKLNGNGLGLYVAQKTVASVGGSMTLTNKIEGHGALVKIRLPLRPDFSSTAVTQDL